MANIKDVAAYILSSLPRGHKVSNARLTKICYLADWKRAIESRKTITEIHWYFDHFGPFVWDVVNTIREYPKLFAVEELARPGRERLTLISLKDRRYSPLLEVSEREAIDHVLEVTKDLPWPDFIHLVYSTYPILTTEKYKYLSLVDLAEEYARY